MKESIYERIGLMEDNGVISKKVADYTRNVADKLLLEIPKVSLDKLEMFITHLAMAGKRAEEGAEEIAIDRELYADLMQEPVYPKAVEFQEWLLDGTDIVFNRTEKDFLTVHLCNLLS